MSNRRITINFEHMETMSFEFDTDDHRHYLSLCPTDDEVREYVRETMEITVEEVDG